MLRSALANLYRPGAQTGALVTALGFGLSIEPQVECPDRGVLDGGTPAAGELPDAVHRIVVVGGQQEGAARREAIGLADQTQGTGCVGRENAQVVVG